MTEQDIIIETDLVIQGGDIKIGNANQQNIKHLLIAEKGNYIMNPTVGAGVYRLTNAPINDLRSISATIKNTLITDGYSNIEMNGEFDDKTNQTSLDILAIRIKISENRTV